MGTDGVHVDRNVVVRQAEMWGSCRYKCGGMIGRDVAVRWIEMWW